MLLLGSDTRAGGNSSLGGGASQIIAHSDTTILPHVYADHKHAVGKRDRVRVAPPQA